MTIEILLLVIIFYLAKMSMSEKEKEAQERRWAKTKHIIDQYGIAGAMIIGTIFLYSICGCLPK